MFGVWKEEKSKEGWITPYGWLKIQEAHQMNEYYKYCPGELCWFWYFLFSSINKKVWIDRCSSHEQKTDTSSQLNTAVKSDNSTY